MKKTKIEWCDSTLNPVVGCTFGCPFCYAKRLNDRFGFVEDFAKPQFFPERLKQLDEKKPQIIFMDSMSDIADWEDEWISAVDKAIEKNPQHNYMFLTKRIGVISRTKSKNVFSLINRANVWLGITITNNADMEERMYELYRLGNLNCKKFISFEPLHEYIKDTLLHYFENIDWVIIGAETGNRNGKIIPQYYWLNNILYYAKTRMPQIPVFMKESMLKTAVEENVLREFPKSFKNQREKEGEKE